VQQITGLRRRRRCGLLFALHPRVDVFAFSYSLHEHIRSVSGDDDVITSDRRTYVAVSQRCSVTQCRHHFSVL